MQTTGVNAGARTFFHGVPYEYSNYRQEILGSKTSAWFGIGLNLISPIYDITGPDALEFFNSVCVNDFSKLKEGSIRHAVMCNDKGQMLTDGVVMSLPGGVYRTYWLLPVIDYYVQNTKYDVTGTVMTGKEFFFQIAGPKSLEILEEAFQEDLHDIKFSKHREVKAGNKTVRVLRLGMAGNLGYEIHGEIQYMDEIYDLIWNAGKKYGMTRLGLHAYTLNHTEAGFPNINIHYPLPWYEDEGLAEYLKDKPMVGAANLNRVLLGSVGDELEQRFVTPYDVGWDFLIKYNHEFRGRAALEKIAEAPRRTVTTLEWNAEDVGKVYAAQFSGRDGLECECIDDEPCDFYYSNIYRADKVFVNGKEIGHSAGRTNSYYYKRMISLAFLEKEYAVEGTPVTILWGTPGKRQMEIRATVAKFPYNEEFGRNEKIDVSTIPHLNKK